MYLHSASPSSLWYESCDPCSFASSSTIFPSTLHFILRIQTKDNAAVVREYLLMHLLDFSWLDLALHLSLLIGYYSVHPSFWNIVQGSPKHVLSTAGATFTERMRNIGKKLLAQLGKGREGLHKRGIPWFECWRTRRDLSGNEGAGEGSTGAFPLWE